MLELNKVKYSLSDDSNSGCDISVSLKLGDSVGFVGYKDSYKSTIIDLIAGFIQPKSGQIKIKDIDVTHAKPAERQCSILFRDGNLFEHLNIFENVLIGINSSLSASKEELVKVNKAIELVGLKGFNRRYPHQISSDQLSKVAIARVVARNAPILLIDDFFSSIEPYFRLEILNLIKDIQQEYKYTLVLVTDDFMDCVKLCDKTAFIDQGKVVLVSDTKEFNRTADNFPKITKYLSYINAYNIKI